MATKDALDWSKSFMYAIHQTHALAEKRLERSLTNAKGISFSQFLILLALHCNKHASQSEIAKFLYLTEASISRQIQQLEKDGYLLKKIDSNNRRRHILICSKKGERAYAGAHRIIEKELKKTFEVVPESDRTHIENAFNKVIAKLLND